MKQRPAQSATSLGRAPKDDADQRMKKYVIMMTIRVVCFILMVVVTPYSWYTWIFGAGAAFLPYIAVVIANAGTQPDGHRAESPERQVTAGPEVAPRPASPDVIRIHESDAPRNDPPKDARS